VVDDDRMMRALIGGALRAEGYQVELAASLAEARQLLPSLAPSLDLLLTDVVMPGGMGPDLVAEIRRAHRWIRVLYMSAHAPDDLKKHGIDLGDAPLLQKPFMPAELAARVREVLE
jgi:DNA-binding response OmpR family regulator